MKSLVVCRNGMALVEPIHFHLLFKVLHHGDGHFLAGWD